MGTASSCGCSSMVTIIMAFFFLLCSSATRSDGSGGRCIERERRALLLIEQDIYQPPPHADGGNKYIWLSSWSATTTSNCCTWRGVSCDNETHHVKKLDLRYSYRYEVTEYEMFGTLPGLYKLNSFLLDLMHLSYLDLSRNNFSGSRISDFIGSLTKLEYLNLSLAGFDGTIPPQIENQFNVVPNWLFNLTSLVHLDLERCGLQPNAQFLDMLAASLCCLRFLGLEGNHIAGQFPAAIGNLIQLEFLYLGSNQLGGSIPNSIGNLVHLLELDLSQNRIIREHLDSPSNIAFRYLATLLQGSINTLMTQAVKTKARIKAIIQAQSNPTKTVPK